MSEYIEFSLGGNLYRGRPIRVRVEKGCWLCESHAPDRYGYPKLKVGGKGETVAHYLYRKLIRDPESEVLRHKCDTPQCVNPYHLNEGTHVQNVADRVSRGRSAIGSRHGRAKLTETQARAILRSKKAPDELARDHGVDKRTITKIKNRETWRHL